MSSTAGRMIKHSSIYAFGNLSRQLIGFIMLPIYTRYLTPADYGVVGLLTVSLSMIDIFFGARLLQAIPKFYHGEKNPLKQNAVISTALILTSTISALTFIALITFSETSSIIIFGRDDLSTVVAIYSTLILTQAIENYGLLYIRILQKPFLFLAFSLSKLALQLSLNIWLVVFLEMGVLGIVITAASASIVLAIVLMGYTLYKTKIHWCFDMAKRLVIFSWPLWLASFAGLYTTLANRYFMRIFGSLDDVGLFELAARFQSIIILLVWQPINQYWQTERFKHYTKGEPATEIYQSVFLAIGTMLILTTLAVSILSAPTIQIMATPDYYGAISIVPILSLTALCLSFIVFMNFSLLVTDNTKWISKNNFQVAFVATFFIIILIPSYGYVGAAIATLLTMFTQLLLTIRASRIHYDMKIRFTPIIYMVIIGTVGYLTANIFIHLTDMVANIAYKFLILILTSILIIWVMWHYTVDKKTVMTLINKILRRKPKTI